ncbi:MAG: WecB/TagA/CpsF family glycosyltransferase [Polaromonas sp.]|nr:WecB/TagA/CpsF family glycosyltransferase [Polaromonas sp.]
MTFPIGWQQRWKVMVAKIQLVATPSAQQQLLQVICSPSQPVVVAFANAHAMNCVAVSPSFFSALRSADWVLRDGSGMAILFKLLGHDPGINLNGTDLIPEIIGLFNGRRIAFFGTQEPYLQQGLVAARQIAPQSHLTGAHGFLQMDAYILLAATQRSELIVLGMGMPKQEAVAAALREQLDFPCTIVCGGAIVDFLAGRTARAPLWMRRAGFEWAYRFALEPKRLFHRYVMGNPVFLARALWLRISGRK